MCCLGTHIAACVQVGRSMGQRLIKQAKKYVLLVSLYALIMNISIGSFIYFARESIALFFTNSPELVSLITSSIGLMSLVIIIHG